MIGHAPHAAISLNIPSERKHGRVQTPSIACLACCFPAGGDPGSPVCADCKPAPSNSFCSTSHSPYTKADADNSRPSKSHYYVKGDLINPKRPRDWTAPVDYRNGTVHIRLEVIEKPAGGEPTTWSLCYIPNRGQGNGYGCTGTVVYREKGVYEQDISMKKFWQNDAIVWSEGIKQMDLVIKDDSGGGGHAHKRADFEKFFPTKVRITMVQVSAGSKYDPSLVPGLPPAGKADGAKPPESSAKSSGTTTGQSCECCGCE